MARHPLADTRMKLKRATEHFKALEKEVPEFITADTIPSNPAWMKRPGGGPSICN